LSTPGGGFIAQLVAAKWAHAGLIALCPAAPGLSGLNLATARIALRHVLEQFRVGIAHAQTEETAREVFENLVWESGRTLFFGLALPWLDRTKAATVDHDAITGPVLVIGASGDRIVPARLERRVAARYQNGTFIEIQVATISSSPAPDYTKQWAVSTTGWQTTTYSTPLSDDSHQLRMLIRRVMPTYPGVRRLPGTNWWAVTDGSVRCHGRGGGHDVVAGMCCCASRQEREDVHAAGPFDEGHLQPGCAGLLDEEVGVRVEDVVGGL
jgi:hypothetical protein